MSTQMSRLRAFRSAEGRTGVLLDFDGTLSPIVARPELAQIREGARDALGRLVTRHEVVAIVSGRTDAELERLVAVAGVRLLGVYGLGSDGSLPDGVERSVREVAIEVPGARVEQKGKSIAVHFRAADDPDAAGRSLSIWLAPIAAACDMQMIGGKRVLELVPGGHRLKDGAVERVVEEERLDAVLYAGDDVADLHAFEVLDRLAARGIATVKVAVRGSETPLDVTRAADAVVDGPAGLVVLLRGL